MPTNTSRLNIATPFSVGQDTNQVAIPVIESTWDERLKDYAADYQRGGRVEIWDWVKEKQVGTLRYPNAPGIGDMMFSPDGKVVACTFKDLSIGLYSKFGVLDFLDAKTGAIVWHTSSAKGYEVGYPFAFLSPTKFVSRNSLYDLTTKKAQPFIKDGERRKFVGSSPRYPNRLFFLTKNGLELWDWPTKRALRRWSKITEADEVTLSPDLTIMSVQTSRKSTVAENSLNQFWKFDAAWLK